MNSLQVDKLTFQNLGPFSFSIAAGECLGLSGTSGAGKSLLLRAIADLIPHQGTVRLGTQLCNEIPPFKWRKQVGLLPSESQWWYDRVGDHFTQVNLDWFERLGFAKEVLGWSLARCSTGEKQRLALLRLLCQQPAALLLDEPTASLDPQAIDRVEDLLREYRQVQQVPVLWVSHAPLQLQRVATRTMQLAKGVLRETRP